MKGTMSWKVNTPGLLREIANNNGMQVLNIPLNIFQRLLALVAKRASELNDRELNRLMLQLALYEAGDPESKSFNRKVMREYGL